MRFRCSPFALCYASYSCLTTCGLAVYSTVITCCAAVVCLTPVIPPVTQIVTWCLLRILLHTGRESFTRRVIPPEITSLAAILDLTKSMRNGTHFIVISVKFWLSYSDPVDCCLTQAGELVFYEHWLVQARVICRRLTLTQSALRQLLLS